MEQEKIFASKATNKRTNLQNIKTSHGALYQKDRKTQPKNGQKRQKAHEKMLNITNYQKRASRNYNEVLLRTSQNGHH